MALLQRLAFGDEAARAELYRLVQGVTFIRFCDSLLEEVRRSGMDRMALRPVARWFLEHSPDYEPFKLGLALLEVCGDASSDLQDVLLAAGDDEFTIFAADALWGLSETPVDLWLELADSLRGWGKVHLVLRLCSRGADRADVRDWLVRRGCRNTVLDEYLAWPCAAAGGLSEALAAEAVDDELLEGAGDIIAGLCQWGGPGGAMPDYSEGVPALRRYLAHLEVRPPSVTAARALASAVLWLSAADPGLEDILAEHGWKDHVRTDLGLRCLALLQTPEWQDWTARGLASEDRDVREAAEAVQGALSA